MIDKTGSHYVEEVLNSGALDEALSLLPQEAQTCAAEVLKYLIHSPDAWVRLDQLRQEVRTKAYIAAYKQRSYSSI